jgi:chromosome segregation ATPase
MDIQEEIQRMEERLNEVEAKLDSIDQKVSRMYNALVGDEVLKTQGLVSRIERTESAVRELKEFKRRIMYGVAGIVALGLLADFLIRLFSNLQK